MYGAAFHVAVIQKRFFFKKFFVGYGFACALFGSSCNATFPFPLCIKGRIAGFEGQISFDFHPSLSKVPCRTPISCTVHVLRLLFSTINAAMMAGVNQFRVTPPMAVKLHPPSPLHFHSLLFKSDPQTLARGVDTQLQHTN